MVVEIPLWVQNQVWKLKGGDSHAKQDIDDNYTVITKFFAL